MSFLQLQRKKRKIGLLNFIPEKYQAAVIKFMVSHGAAAVFLDPGLGKTVCSIYSFDILKKKRMAKKLLVVSSRRIIHNVWPQELAKWGFNLTHTLIYGNPKKRLAALQHDVDVYLTNYDTLPWLAALKRREVKLPDWDILIIDESTKFKNTRTLRFRSLKKLLQRKGLFRRRYILTGTPTPKSLLDLYGQLYILDGGQRLGNLFTSFRIEYFRPAGFYGREWRPYIDSEARILNKIKDITIRFDEEQLHLPPLVPIVRRVQLPDKARRQYTELEKEFFTQLDSGDIVSAGSAAIASMKLRQMANGHVYLDKDPLKPKIDKDRPWKVIHDEKVEELVELVDELNGHPLLIGYEFSHDLRHIEKYLGEKVPHIDGHTKDTEATKLIEQFNKGALPWLFGQISSVAHGLNLQAECNHLAYFGMTWNYEDYEQFWRRIRRKGQKKRTFAYHIIAEQTVEEAVFESSQIKGDNQRRLLNTLKQYWKESHRGK